MILATFSRPQVDVAGPPVAVVAGGTSPLPRGAGVASEGLGLAPEPNPAGLDVLQDGLSMMYALVSKEGQLSMTSGENGVRTMNRQQQTEASKQESALKREEADEAAMETGSLFGAICHVFSDLGDNLAAGRIGDACTGTVSDTVNTLDSPHLLSQLEQLAPQVAEYVGVAAAIVGAAALTASSGGAGGIAVAAVVVALSASGMLAEKTGCFGKDSAYIGMGLEIAGAAVSFGASSAMVANSALVTASSAMDVASGTADVLAGASTVLVGEQQAQATDDTADVQQATAALNRNARLLADLVQGLKDAQHSNQTALHAVADAVHGYGQSLTLAAAGTKV